MRRCTISDEGFSAFLSALFAGENGVIWQIRVSDAAIENSVGDSLIAAMIERGNQGLPFALPLSRGETDHWIATGGDRFALERAVARMGRTLAPSFACFSGANRAAMPQVFQPDGNAIQATGSRRFPQGYYSFASPLARRQEVRARLTQWTNLEAKQPPPRDEAPLTYGQLVQHFHAAAAASQWGDAEAALETLDRLNLSSADNLRFLRLELLARQGRWSDIWEAADRRRIVELRLPRAARAALLQAFHTTILAPIEEAAGVSAALERYRAERPGLSGLLSGRYGLEQAPVLMAFGYEAVHSGDREALAALERQAEEPTRSMLHALGALLQAPVEAASTPSDADELVRAALQFGDLDAALVAADDVANPIRRLAARIEIAARSSDAPLCVEVLVEFDRAGPSAINDLLTTNSELSSHLMVVVLCAGRGPNSAPSASELVPTWMNVMDWFSWFRRAATAPLDHSAHAALDRITGGFERSFSDAWAAELSESILIVGTDAERRRQLVFRDAIRRLAAELVAETGFPRVGLGARELYEVVVTELVETTDHSNEQSLLLLALIEVILAHQPGRVSVFAALLNDWFAQPIPALEQRALDAIELVIDYGIGPEFVADHVRTWIEDLLARPTPWDATRIAVWQRLIRWTQSGPDLELSLAERLVEGAAEAEDDPIAALPAGFHIAIFTLRLASAERAKSIMLERNSGIRVTLCDSKVLTEKAKELAKGADMPVIVTRCLTHALTEGIRHFLAQEPVYPPASGASGILIAVTEAARSVVGAGLIAA